jgi:hypothetical protein
VFLVVKTNPLHLAIKSPVVAGLFCMLLLFYGCQAARTPEEVTMVFWQALAKDQIEIAKSYATQSTRYLVNLQDIEKYATIKTGQAVINDVDASVETTITRNNKPVSFNTVLVKEKDGWKVDYQQTRTNIAMIPFDGVVKSLENLGNAFGKQMEQQIPIIEKEMESIGDELKKQIDEFGKSLEKPVDPGKKPKPHPGAI